MFWFTLNTSYDARAGGQSEVMAEATADALVEVMAEATAEATAEVTEGGGVTRVCYVLVLCVLLRMRIHWLLI